MEWLNYVLGGLALAAILATIAASFYGVRQKTIIEILQKSNDAYKERNDQLEDEKAEQIKEAARKDKEYLAKLSGLEGRITTLEAIKTPPFEPMMAIQSSVTRTDLKGTVWGANQKVTADEAIRIGTMHGAYASYEENTKGSIESGKHADLVVLGRDPYKEDPSTLVTIPIERTMAGGKWVYES